jgi:hypothetical protein
VPSRCRIWTAANLGRTDREGLAARLRMKGMTKKADPPTKRSPEGGQTSEEYDSFERLTKRLVRVPKDEIKHEEERKKKRKRA